MIVRLENSRDGFYLVVDEIDRFIGKIDMYDFLECVIDDSQFTEDNYTYYSVNKAELMLKIF